MTLPGRPLLLLLAIAACGGDDDGAADAGAGGVDAAWIDHDASPCARVEVALGPVTPTVLILINRSGTMTDPFGGVESRWAALYRTLMRPGSGVISQLEESVRFGIAAYTARDQDNDGAIEGACPRMNVVEPALGNRDAIDDVYRPLDPLDETPTGAAVESALATLAAVSDEGPKILVLATDGEPDTCAAPNPNGSAQARSAALAAVEAAFAADVRTYAISVGGDAVGNPQAQRHMQEVANAGVGLPPGGAEEAPLYVALEPDALVAAFDEIIGGVRTCTFTLEGEVGEEHAPGGTVTLDGEELTYGVDWRLIDSMTLELLGAACDAVMAGGEHEVRAYFTCEAIVD